MPSIADLGPPLIYPIMWQMKRLVALALITLSPASAETDPFQEAFLAGDFVEARRLAEAENTADSLAFAARSQLATVVLSATDRASETEILEAETLARAALSRDPDHIEGRLQLAIALSLRARPLSAREVLRTGYGEMARDLAMSILSEDPDHLYSHSFLAVWHIEVVRRGGELGATMVGGSLRKAHEHYAEARRLDDGSADTHWQSARALAARIPRRHRAEIDAALERALAARTETPLEWVMQSRAQALQTALGELSTREIRQLANANL